jgi:hypothetical protein
MFNVAIYSKTLKGRMEILERRHGLSLRLRQALILVDGHTPYGMLRVMLQHLGDPDEIIGQLSALGMVVSDYDLPDMPVFGHAGADDHSSIMQ